MPQSRMPIVFGVALAFLQALLVVAFSWAPTQSAPRDLPIGVAGPAPAVTRITQTLETARPGGFEITAFADEAAAKAAIEDREVYGAIVVTGQTPRLLVASAASPAVAQLLTEAANQLAAAAPPAAQVTDVVANNPDDARGTGFAMMILPLVISGIAASALLSFLLTSTRQRFTALAVFAVGAGLLTTLVSVTWLGLMPSSAYGKVAAVGALVTFTVPAAIGGLGVFLGRPGFGLGAAATFLLGNPFSAAGSAPELLPQPWGTIGQYLPPGAAATLMRSVAYFDGAGAARPLAVLACFALAGVVLLVLGGRRGPAAPERPASDDTLVAAA
ncbi:hypothetical protein EDD29_6361 [Actinocorallia herbida]|uniref:ABC transporter permease n=1 Tax=Actinocorallia herbida TaxID=58109 RepID=A0A3N1D581_9ACTN|nr:hypothetical protein [Actinocorallia herbida]ROO88687.1 hypothetical protein EDD29_6361 [Actinocorallia herbida]